MTNLVKASNKEVQPQTNASALVRALSVEEKSTIMQLCMPNGATDEDLAMYLHRCKELELDPLGGDLVLQKRNTKEGVKLNFITTRDAMLKIAERNAAYDGIISGVVKEGDIFSVDTKEGIVTHQFGTKRGKILAGWAVVYHKKRKPVVFVSDFLEYFNANSISPVWRSLPSAMIVKVAEVGALRRQFPVGGQIYTREEMYLEEEAQASSKAIRVVTDIEEVTPTKHEQAIEQKPEPKASASAEEKAKDEAVVYQLVQSSVGKSSTGVPFAKLQASLNGESVLLLARGEDGLLEASKLSENCSFTAQTFEENGFNFISSLNVLQEAS